MIRIEFDMIEDGYAYRDVIVLPENHGLSNEQIETIKAKRFRDWRYGDAVPIGDVRTTTLLEQMAQE